jgi:ABC-type lipoprotein export system ATPase subunit
MNKQTLLNMRIEAISIKHDFLIEMLEDAKLVYNRDSILNDVLNESEIQLAELEMTKDEFVSSLVDYVSLIGDVVEELDHIELTIMPGNNKFGQKEVYDKLHIEPGEIVCIVGPTGSGKSRLLADIEWAANHDTPTDRQILINGETLDPTERFKVGNKLVAQLSQNMNFVMDLTVYEFIKLHATSRLVKDVEDVVVKIHEKANDLAGEKFDLHAHITSLSGGQSRALMIADTAFLSKSPIVLIDELENAGIDRRSALELLVSNDKIVLMATHDPILALMGDKRIIIKDGGIADIIATTEEELEVLTELEKIDKLMFKMRNNLRTGKTLKKSEVIEYA